MKTIEENVFYAFNKILDKYINNVDSSLIKSSISKSLLSQIINSTLLKALSKHYSISKKDMKSLFESFYQQNKKSKIKTIKKKIKKETVIPQEIENEEVEPKEKVLSEEEKRREFIKEFLKKAPVIERVLFKPVLIEYLNNPSTKGLINLNKVIDRYDKIHKSSVPTVKLIPYKRPDWLAPKQHYIADEVQKSYNMFVHGDRQTGKDSSIAVGKFEQLITKKRQQPLFFMASKKETAKNILKKILAEDRFKYLQDHIHTVTDYYILFYCQDGGVNRFQIIDTTESAVKGITGDLWVDDIDTIIKDGKGDVITLGIMVTRANPEINFCFTSNMGKGSYINFLETIKDPKWKDQVKIYELKKGDVPHIIAEKDAFLFAVAESLSGTGVARAQLLNEYNREGDIFDPNSLFDAQQSYEFFISQRVPDIPIERIILSIDPSGIGHPFGWCVFAFGSDSIWELESGEIQMGDPDVMTNEKWSPSRINAFMVKKAREYNVNYVITESNSTGPSMIINLRSNNIICKLRNFGAETAINSHSNKNRLVRHFLDERMMVIKNNKLISQLRVYNPFISKTKLKGDLADAFIHCIWELVGGYKYLHKISEDQKRMQTSIVRKKVQRGFF